MNPTKDARPHAPSWQEIAETQERTRGEFLDGSPADAFRVPPWQALLAEGVRVRAAFCDGDEHRARFASMYGMDSHARGLGTITPPPPESYTITNAQHFQFLPSVERIKSTAVDVACRLASIHRSPALMLTARMWNGGADVPAHALLSDAEKQNLETTVRAEQSHMLYHKAMWRAHGRRVVVLDPTTYTLLAHTDLPPFPASMLAAPWPAFYIQLPPRTFEFDVLDVRTHTVDRRFAEGVCVAIDYPEPGSDDTDHRVRELAFMVMGEDEGQGAEGRNAAFATIRFGPGATLDQFAKDGAYIQQRSTMGPNEQTLEYARVDFAGAHDLAVFIPRVIVGLMLYLASEHPDVVPVAPAPRRTFADVRSPLQRAAALKRQAEKLRAATRLPVLVIGSRLAEIHARELEQRIRVDEKRTGKRWTLDRAVWVRGHWRNQPHGPGRTERRLTWIRPFVRGPDAAESMAIRAARVPRAQLNPDAE